MKKNKYNNDNDTSYAERLGQYVDKTEAITQDRNKLLKENNELKIAKSSWSKYANEQTELLFEARRAIEKYKESLKEISNLQNKLSATLANACSLANKTLNENT